VALVQAAVAQVALAAGAAALAAGAAARVAAVAARVAAVDRARIVGPIGHPLRSGLRKFKPEQATHIRHLWRAMVIIAAIGAVGVVLMIMLREP